MNLRNVSILTAADVMGYNQSTQIRSKAPWVANQVEAALSIIPNTKIKTPVTIKTLEQPLSFDKILPKVTRTRDNVRPQGHFLQVVLTKLDAAIFSIERYYQNLTGLAWPVAAQWGALKFCVRLGFKLSADIITWFGEILFKLIKLQTRLTGLLVPKFYFYLEITKLAPFRHLLNQTADIRELEYLLTLTQTRTSLPKLQTLLWYSSFTLAELKQIALYLGGNLYSLVHATRWAVGHLYEISYTKVLTRGMLNALQALGNLYANAVSAFFWLKTTLWLHFLEPVLSDIRHSAVSRVIYRGLQSNLVWFGVHWGST